MRFLADESCDFAIVRALRGAGHDVLAVAEIAPRAEDPEVVQLAVGEGRLLLTEDKDFGRIVFADDWIQLSGNLTKLVRTGFHRPFPHRVQGTPLQGPFSPEA